MTLPERHLEAAYREAETRMAGLPVFNPRLAVEAVGFREWDEGRRIGVLVSPWFMNLVLLPGPGDDWSGLAPGSRQTWALPDGEYPFVVAAAGEVPRHQNLALFSAVTDFPDMETARAVAREVMGALFTVSDGAAPPSERPPQAGGVREPLSRRDLLRRAVGAGRGEGP
jgi:[NiFe] hydrogenase assembly HybE family chaperone